jgi:hypothetical protein
MKRVASSACNSIIQVLFLKTSILLPCEQIQFCGLQGNKFKNNA